MRIYKDYSHNKIINMSVYKLFLTILFFNNIITSSNAFITKPVILNNKVLTKVPTLYLKKNINTDMFNDYIYNRKSNITFSTINDIVNISSDTKKNKYIFIEDDNETDIFNIEYIKNISFFKKYFFNNTNVKKSESFFNLDNISYENKIILRIYIYIFLTYYFIFLAFLKY